MFGCRGTRARRPSGRKPARRRSIIEVPTGVGARIRSQVALGSTDVDQARFPRTIDGYASPDYATATNRADIDVRGGLGSVQVVGVA